MNRNRGNTKSNSRATSVGASKDGDKQEPSSNNELHQLLLDELADILNAEQQLLKALPKMAKAANSDELREAFESHLEETQNQVSRLEEVFSALDETPKRKKCKAMEGLLEEGKEMMEEKKDSAALDAALIAAAQKVEHYEIASYGSVCAWAEMLGHSDALELLQETLAEEKDADEKLTQIAESVANIQAEQSEEKD